MMTLIINSDNNESYDFISFLAIYKRMSSIKMMPLALLDKCIGEQLWVIMKNKR